MKKIFKAVSVLAFVQLSLICALPANAAPVIWYLDAITRADGGSVSGSFTYDAVTNTYSAISITSTAGSSTVPAETYSQPDPLSDAQLLYLRVPGDLTGENAIDFSFPGLGLTDAGGTLTITAASTEFLCSNANCTAVSDSVFLAGQVTSSAPVPPTATAAQSVPTMSLYGLMLMAIGMALVAMRKFQSA